MRDDHDGFTRGGAGLVSVAWSLNTMEESRSTVQVVRRSVAEMRAALIVCLDRWLYSALL
jgi:hypothetical protein